MPIGGFNDYAALRLRDHRPGIGDYQLPPVLGPNSGSSERTIFGKHRPPTPPACGAGPGEYVIPTSIGTGRATRFGPPLPVDENGNAVLPERDTAANAKTTPRGPVPSAPKQYSMALSPDTPAYSIYGKLKGEWETKAENMVGPGAYDVPYSSFAAPSRGVQPGAHFGIRTVSAAEREKGATPGPGAYDLERFGDVVPPAREIPLGRRRPHRPEVTPGPGEYDDPTTIAARTAVRKRFTNTSTFGGRWTARQHRSAGPGPAYNTTEIDKVLERNVRHAPRFRPPPSQATASASSSARMAQTTGGAPPFYDIPSDFDYHYLKGKSMLGKWPAERTHADDAGLSAFQHMDEEKSLDTGRATRFAPVPFDAESAARAMAENEAQVSASLGGPGLYNPNYDAVQPSHTRGALFGTASKMPPSANDVPGPGHYHPNYEINEAEHKGTVFYKGDFHDRSDKRREAGPGPGEHYNDFTPYSQSIAGDRSNGKGYTMRIRYPARATHQVAPPCDATTNINCVYPDERTWETKVNFGTGASH